MSNLVRASRIEMYSGSKELVVGAQLSHGAGKRNVAITVPAKTVIEIADWLRKFKPDHYGHAFWHYEHQGHAFPCSTCTDSLI